jgi:hypothetical protein
MKNRDYDSGRISSKNKTPRGRAVRIHVKPANESETASRRRLQMLFSDPRLGREIENYTITGERGGSRALHLSAYPEAVFMGRPRRGFPKMQITLPFSQVTGLFAIIENKTIYSRCWIRLAIVVSPFFSVGWLCTFMLTGHRHIENIQPADRSTVFRPSRHAITPDLSKIHVHFPRRRKWCRGHCGDYCPEEAGVAACAVVKGGAATM